MNREPLSNPFILGMLQRLGREDIDFDTYYDVLGTEQIRVSDKDIYILNEQIYNLLNRTNQQRFLKFNLAQTELLVLNNMKNEREINQFFSLKAIYDDMKIVKLPLSRYIKESRAINQIPDLMLNRFIMNSNEIIRNERGQMNNAFLNKTIKNMEYVSHRSFSDILRDRNALSRYTAYQKKEIMPVVNDAFKLSSIIFKIIFNPFKYWNQKTVRLLKERVKIRKQFINQLHYNRNLTEAALNQNIDNFFHRWFHCMDIKTVDELPDTEKDSIAVFLSQKELLDRIMHTSMIPEQVKALMKVEPMKGFKKMIEWNHNRRQEKDNHFSETLINKLASKSNHENNQYPYPLGLLDMLKALVKKDKAMQVYGENVAIADGILNHAKPIPLKRRAKRLNRLSNYMKVLSSIEESLVSMDYDFTYLENTPYQASFYFFMEEIILFSEQNEKALKETKEGQALNSIFDNLLKALKKMNAPDLLSMDTDTVFSVNP